MTDLVRLGLALVGFAAAVIAVNPPARRREHSPKVSLMRRRLRTSDIGLLILVGALLWVLGSHLLRAWR